jgi:DNA-binding NarL/FixJ family response regulator
MIKLLIVEDYPILTEGFISIFKTIPDFEITGLTINAKECIQFLKHTCPDVILIDLMFCGSLCLKLVNDIRNLHPNPGILLLSSPNNPHYINHLLIKGINGCLPKNTCPGEIIDAIRAISIGKTYFDEELKYPGLNGSKILNCISRREIEVLRMISGGMTNREIADTLNISPLTVDSHRKNLIIKLGAKNTASLVKISMEMGYI